MLAGAEDHLAIFSSSGVSQTIAKHSTWGQCPQVPAGPARKVAKSARLLGCRKWGFKRWGFKEIRGYLRKKALFLRFLGFPGALGALRKRAKKAEKGRFWLISADFQEGRPDPHCGSPSLCSYAGGNFRHKKMTTLVGNRGQLWTSTLSPHLVSPPLDFPNNSRGRENQQCAY